MNTNSREIAELLFSNEKSLLDPAVRRDHHRLLALLADDFVEFGASGRVWSRDQIVESLATEDFQPPAMEAFQCRVLAPAVALITYRTMRTNAQTDTRTLTLRSSVWVEQDGKWRLRFHQGTPTAPQGSHGKTSDPNH
ncbi:MAG: nuclear transport factor 2 family protein [Terracidiphilus sp.]